MDVVSDSFLADVRQGMQGWDEVAWVAMTCTIATGGLCRNMCSGQVGRVRTWAKGVGQGRGMQHTPWGVDMGGVWAGQGVDMGRECEAAKEEKKSRRGDGNHHSVSQRAVQACLPT
eukprot:366303-Chlamydomonas_euryale.AAC.1